MLGLLSFWKRIARSDPSPSNVSRKQRPKTIARQVKGEPAPLPVSDSFFERVTTALILSVYVVLLIHPIDLTAGDLGRHLKNGELFVQNGLLAKVNLYSYVYPNFPFINHHWGTGVIFYVVEHLLGFRGLSFVFALISVVTLWLFLKLASQLSSFPTAVMTTIVCIPILITRHEIRPEVFTYFLSAVFLQILWAYKFGRLGFHVLFFLPLLQILWVNLHIYFFIGVLLIAAFLCESLIAIYSDNSTKSRTDCKHLALVLALTVLASCVNPAGLSGALYPLFILQGYEFPVIENYSVAAVLSHEFRFLPLIYFLVITAMLGLSWIYILVKDRARISYANLLLSAMVIAMSWLSIRNFGLLAFFAAPLTAANLANTLFSDGWYSHWTRGRTMAALVLIAGGLFVVSPEYFIGGGRGSFGIGLKDGTQSAGEFMRREHLHGPIFNNFDIGGYLTYYLYPQERVFVDNRPEAYPSAFFRDDYFPMLQDAGDWNRRSAEFNLNTIVFNHRDRSDASEQFIVSRVLDPAWAPVFFDRTVIIFVKRNISNEAIIKTHELNREEILSKSG